VPSAVAAASATAAAASAAPDALPLGCFGAGGFGWGSSSVPLRSREMWLERPAGQFGAFPVQVQEEEEEEEEEEALLQARHTCDRTPTKHTAMCFFWGGSF
jgi:hypothetical protein